MTRSVLLLAGVVAVTGCAGQDLTVYCEDFPDQCEFDQTIDMAEEDVEADQVFVSEDAEMCVAANGNIYAVWTDDRRGFFRDVWFNSSRDGGRTWFPTPIRVTRGSGDASGVSMDCSGDQVFVAWEDTRDSETGYQNIYVNISNDGGVTWLDEDIRLDDDPEGRSISLGPQILFSRGAVHVVWFDQISGAPDIYVAYSPNQGKLWSSPVRVSGPAEEPGSDWSGNPRITTDGQNRLQIVWEDTRHGTQDIFHTRAEKAVTDLAKDEILQFSGQSRLTKGEPFGTTYGFRPAIAAQGKEVYVVWHDTRAGDARDVFMNYSSDGGATWLDAASRVDSDAAGANESLNASICMVGNRAHITWQDNRFGGYDIFYRQSVDGGFEEGSDEEDNRLDRGDAQGSGNSVNPQIHCYDETILVAWEDRRAALAEGLNDLYYNFCDFDPEDGDCDFQSRDLRLDSVLAGTKYTEDLSVGLFEDEVYALWVDNRDGSTESGVTDKDVRFSYCELGKPVDTYEAVAAAAGAKL